MNVLKVLLAFLRKGISGRKPPSARSQSGLVNYENTPGSTTSVRQELGAIGPKNYSRKKVRHAQEKQLA